VSKTSASNASVSTTSVSGNECDSAGQSAEVDDALSDAGRLNRRASSDRSAVASEFAGDHASDVDFESLAMKPESHVGWDSEVQSDPLDSPWRSIASDVISASGRVPQRLGTNSASDSTIGF